MIKKQALFEALFLKMFDMVIPQLTVKIAMSLLRGAKLEISPFTLSREGIHFKSWLGDKFCSWDWSPRSSLSSTQRNWSDPRIVFQLIHRITFLSKQTITREVFGEIKCSADNFLPFANLLLLNSPQPYEDSFTYLPSIIQIMRGNYTTIEAAEDCSLKRSLMSRFAPLPESEYEIVFIDDKTSEE